MKMKEKKVLLWEAAVVFILCFFFSLTSYAYSHWWQMDNDGYWFYNMPDGSQASSTWIHDEDDGEWYLLSGTGAMLTGVIYTNEHYYFLDTVRGTGTYGKLLKEGDTHNGITIHADTSPEYEGALTDETIDDLMAHGIDFSYVPSIGSMQQIENGTVTVESGNRFADSAKLDAYVGKYVYQNTTKKEQNPANGKKLMPYDSIIVSKNRNGSLHMRFQYNNAQTKDLNWGQNDIMLDSNGVGNTYHDKVGEKLKKELLSVVAYDTIAFTDTSMSFNYKETRVWVGDTAAVQYDITDVYKKTEGNENGLYTDFDWSFSGDHAVVARYNGQSSEVNIPSRFAGVPVKEIAGTAFLGCANLKSISFPSGMTKIGFSAFESCTSLTDISIPSGVEKLEGSTFSDCSSLTNVHIPSSVAELENTAFMRCTNLQSITVDAGNRNFSDIDGILFSKDKSKLLFYPGGKAGNSYSIPKSVTEIALGAFRECKTMTDLTVEEGNKALSSRDGVLFSADSTKLICCPPGKGGSYTVPYGVKEISDGAFYGCRQLQEVEISDTVEKLGTEPFGGCINLRSVTVPSSVTEMGSFALNCTNLDDIYYKGTQEQWNAIKREDPERTVKKSATIHFNA